MPKPSYKPLFPANELVDVEIDSIDRVFVDNRLDSPVRRRLTSQLRLFIGYLESLGLSSYEIWIDGSFSTYDPNPVDIDVVCFISKKTASSLTPERSDELAYFAGEEGRPYVRERWNIDFYIGDFDSLEERNYWKDRFSGDKYGGAKGIGRVRR